MCAVERTHSLPVSRSDSPPQQREGSGGLRRRLSSLSLKIHPISSSWARLQRSKSLSSIREHAGGSLRKWWDWGTSWLQLTKKPRSDLEMMDGGGDQQALLAGQHAEPRIMRPAMSSSSWRHVYYKVRSEIRKLTGINNKVGLPQTYRYNSFDYSKNFDDGNAWER